MDRNSSRATAEKLTHCRTILAQVEQTLQEMNRSTKMDNWSPEIGQSYRMVLYDISALDAFLLAYRMEQG